MPLVTGASVATGGERFLVIMNERRDVLDNFFAEAYLRWKSFLDRNDISRSVTPKQRTPGEM